MVTGIVGDIKVVVNAGIGEVYALAGAGADVILAQGGVTAAASVTVIAGLVGELLVVCARGSLQRSSNNDFY